MLIFGGVLSIGACLNPVTVRNKHHHFGKGPVFTIMIHWFSCVLAGTKLDSEEI